MKELKKMAGRGRAGFLAGKGCLCYNEEKPPERRKRGGSMTPEEFAAYIEEKISPYILRENGRAALEALFQKYPEELLLECAGIGLQQYLRRGPDGTPTQESVENFLSKLGGIAYNRARSPIQQEIARLKNKGKRAFSYWNDKKAEELLLSYVQALRGAGWDDGRIAENLQTEAGALTARARNWSQWADGLREWVEDWEKRNRKDPETVEQHNTIIPDAVVRGTPAYIQSLSRQINASYENHLYDCCAVMMRRLLEVLLVLCFQHAGKEEMILDRDGARYLPLDRIIQLAGQNAAFPLSPNGRADMRAVKNLGNFSAHRIYYTCTQQDIQPHLLKYRGIVEELLYKSGLR